MTSPSPSPRSPRVPLVRAVQIRPVDVPLEPRRCLLADLSRGGMFIRTPEPFMQGTRLWVSLEVRGQPLPFGEVEVAWQRPRGEPPGFGARFMDLAPRARALVDHLVFLCTPPKAPPIAGPPRPYLFPPGLKRRR